MHKINKFRLANQGEIRINWNNVCYVKILKETKDYFDIEFYWRYKAAINKKEVRLLIEEQKDQNSQKILYSFGLTKINSTYINLSQILFTEEELNNKDKFKIKFTFNNGLGLYEETEIGYWENWRSSNLR